MGKDGLKKRSRLELLELLEAQMQENERLRAQVEELKAQVNDRRIVMERSGSLAEAALRLSGIFEAADEAVRLYKESVGYEEPEES